MAQVLVRDLDKALIERLKARAEQHGRSLQVELKLILQQAAGPDMAEARKLAARLRRKLAGRAHSDSAVLVAEDRAR
jgi:plasmid stability protein